MDIDIVTLDPEAKLNDSDMADIDAVEDAQC